MDYRKLSIIDLKVVIFEQEFSKFPYLNDFLGNPYTYLKARYYMYSSVLLVYVLLRTSITPNMVTLAYIASGLVGGVLLSIPNFFCNVAAVVIFFNRGILDWSDGHLARLKYEPTLTGHILDVYGASVNSIGLVVGLGFFAMHQTGYTFLIYAIAIAPFLHGAKYTSFGLGVILMNLNELVNNKQTDFIDSIECEIEKEVPSLAQAYKYPRIVVYFSNIFDDNARSVDFILMTVLLDYYFNYKLTFFIFLIIVLKMLIKFILSIVIGVRSKWAESIIDNIAINNARKKNE